MNLPQSSYVGRHAELYDLFYADKPYAQEAHFVHGCIQNFGSGKQNRVLELACGTGNHAFEMEKLGYQVVAIDYSADMLLQARHKAHERGSRVDFRQQDMRMLDVPERPFDAILCLFDSIGYVATNVGISRVLRGIRDHLRPGGLFVFEFWHAVAMVKYYEPVRVKRWKVPMGEVIRISETELDYAHQLAKVSYTVHELLKDGTHHTFSEVQTNRYFLLQEMESILSAAGFQLIKAYDGFQEDEKIKSKTWHIVAVASSTSGHKGV